jgi:hypothetical protein
MKSRKKKAEFVHISSIIDNVLKMYRLENDTGLTDIWNLWNSIVGSTIAENAKPAAIKGRLLLVHVASSTWIHQLQFLKDDIVKTMNMALGKEMIDDIKFKIGPL